jgi:hypothetical protein
MARHAPTKEALMIHQVVSRFQRNIARYVSLKNFDLLLTLSANRNKGTKPKKMNSVNGEVGQLNHRIIPAAIDKNTGCVFLLVIIVGRQFTIDSNTDNHEVGDFYRYGGFGINEKSRRSGIDLSVCTVFHRCKTICNSFSNGLAE